MSAVIQATSLGTKYVLDAAALDRIRRVLREGGLLVYPTDTAYGLGADPFHDGAVARLYEVKGRPRDQPVSMAVADLAEVFRFGERTSLAEAFCAKHLPGPYTVVLRATSHAPRSIVSATEGLALRIPPHPIPRLLAKAYGPITATSANRHGRVAPETCDEAREQLGEDVDLYLDGGPTQGGESSVIDLTGPKPKVLRQGTIRAGG